LETDAIHLGRLRTGHCSVKHSASLDLGKAYEGEPVNARIARPGIPSMRSASGKSPFSRNYPSDFFLSRGICLLQMCPLPTRLNHADCVGAHAKHLAYFSLEHLALQRENLPHISLGKLSEPFGEGFGG
jgi:hypothetical protein